MKLFVCEYASGEGMFGMKFVSADSAKSAIELFNDSVDQDENWDVRVFLVPAVASEATVHDEAREILWYQSQDDDMNEGVGDYGDGKPVNRAVKPN